MPHEHPLVIQKATGMIYTAHNSVVRAPFVAGRVVIIGERSGRAEAPCRAVSLHNTIDHIELSLDYSYSPKQGLGPIY